MLAQLEIHNFILIAQETLHFKKGLTVLTGETGAGKSLILNALNFLFGQRPSKQVALNPQKDVKVSCVFENVDSSMGDLLEAHDIPKDTTLILRKNVTPEGRARLFVNDVRVTTNFLKSLFPHLIDLHGQFDGVIDAKTHMGIIDKNIEDRALIETVHSAYQSMHSARNALKDCQDNIAKLRQEETQLRENLAELDKFSPQEDEETSLLEERQQHKSYTSQTDLLQKALSTISADSGLRPQLNSLQRHVDKFNAPTLDDTRQKIDQVADILFGIEDALQDVLHQTTLPDKSPDEIEERLYKLRELARKHNCAPAELHPLHKSFADKILSLDTGTANLGDLEASYNKAVDQYGIAAAHLSKARIKSAQEICHNVNAILPHLKLEKASLNFNHTTSLPEAGTARGVDDFVFTVKTNTGKSFHPIGEIASGGERSRLLLAFKSVTADEKSPATRIFDEIDQGVGGAVADAIGAHLEKLALHQQIIVITHAPQVAAYGDQHFFIQKTDATESTVSSISPLEDESAKLHEIARMLSGASITQEAKTVAQHLRAQKDTKHA